MTTYENCKSRKVEDFMHLDTVLWNYLTTTVGAAIVVVVTVERQTVKPPGNACHPLEDHGSLIVI